MHRRQLITKWFNRLHMGFHALCGWLLAVGMTKLTGVELGIILPYSLIGSFLPDIDHVAFYFIYGRKSDYAKQVKGHLRKLEIRAMFRFFSHNHKNLYGLYSHTWYGILLVIVGSFMGWKHSVELGILFLAMLCHFGFDLIEDLVFFSKLNPNWKGKVLKYSWTNDAERTETGTFS